MAIKYVLGLCSLLVIAQCVSAATVTWTCTTGNWNDGSCWSSSSVPGAGDNVVIDADGTYTVSGTVTVSVASLTVGSSTATGTQTLTYQTARITVGAFTVGSSGVVSLSIGSNDFTFTSGTIDGQLGLVSANLVSSSPLTVSASGSIVVSGASSRNINCNVDVAGTFEWQGGNMVLASSNNLTITGTMKSTESTNAGVLSVDNNGIGGLIIAEGGLLSFEDGTVTIECSTVVTSATVQSTGSGEAGIFKATGTPSQVLSGTNSNFVVAAGSTMHMQMDWNWIDGSIGGPGTYNFDSGTFNLQCNTTVGTLTIDGADVTVGDAFTVQDLTFSSGSLAGDDITINDFTWSDGTLAGANTIDVTGTASFSKSGATITAPNVVFYGDVTVAPATTVTMVDGTLTIAPSAKLTMTAKGTSTFQTGGSSSSGGTPIVAIRGELVVAETADNNGNIAQFSGPALIEEGAKVTVESGGLLQFLDAVTSSGDYTVDGEVFCAGGGSFDFTGGSMVGKGSFIPQSPVTIAADVSVGSVALTTDFTLQGATVSAGTLSLNGAADIGGTGEVNATQCVWTEGKFTFTGNATFDELTHTGDTTVTQTTTQVNVASGRFDASTWHVGDGSVFTVAEFGSFAIENGTFMVNDNGASSIVVRGSLTFEGEDESTSLTTINAELSVHAGGFVNVHGDTTLRDDVYVDGNITIANNASLYFNAINEFTENSGVIGDGLLLFSCTVPSHCGSTMAGPFVVTALTLQSSAPATFTYPDIVVTDVLLVKSGSVNIYGQVTCSRFNWQAGTISGFEILGSAIVVKGLATIADSSNTIEGTELRIEGELQWNEGSVTAGSGAFVTNYGLVSIGGSVTLEYASDDRATFTNHGELIIDVAAHDFAVFQTDFVNTGNITVREGSFTVYSYTQLDDSALILDNGIARYSKTSGWLFTGGKIEGHGKIIGTVGMDGTLVIAAGSTISVDGNFIHGRDGILNLGVNSPSDYGRLDINGSLLIYGAGEVTLGPDYDTNTTVTLDKVITYTSVTPAFSSFTGSVHSSIPKDYAVTYGATSIDIAIEARTAVLESVSPSFLAVTGGSMLTLSGVAFTQTTHPEVVVRVMLGANKASVAGTLVDDTTISAPCPTGFGGATGQGNLIVSLDGGKTFITGSIAVVVYNQPALSGVSPQYSLSAFDSKLVANITAESSAPFYNSPNLMASFNWTGLGDDSEAAVVPATYESGGAVEATVTVPAGSTGASVYVSLDGQTWSDAVAQTFYSPDVTAFNPSIVSYTDGKTVVTASGTGFPTGPAFDSFFVSFTIEDHNATVVKATAVSDKEFTFTAPTVEMPGSADVGLSLYGDEFTPSLGTFSFFGLPNLTALVPSSGNIKGKQDLAIFGSGFLSSTDIKVSFSFKDGTKAVVSGNYAADDVIRCVTPATKEAQSATVRVALDGSTYTSDSLTFNYDSVVVPAKTKPSDVKVAKKGDVSLGAAIGAGCGVGAALALLIIGIYFFVAKGGSGSNDPEKTPILGAMATNAGPAQ